MERRQKSEILKDFYRLTENTNFNMEREVIMIKCDKCGYKMPQHMATPLKCACGELLGTGMFTMVDSQEFAGMLAVMGAVENLVGDTEPMSDERTWTRIQVLRDAFTRFRTLPKEKTAKL